MNLRHLNLSANRLHWFDYAFVPNSLSHLDLHDNLIDSVENYYSLKEGFQLQYLDASQNRFDPIGYNLLLLSSHWLKSILAQGGLLAPVPWRQSEQARSYWYIICSCSLLIGWKVYSLSEGFQLLYWRPVRTGSIFLLVIICSCSLLIGWKYSGSRRTFRSSILMPVRTGSILLVFNLLLLSSHWLKSTRSLKEGFQLQSEQVRSYWLYNLLLLASHWLKSILAQGRLSAPVPGRQSEQVRSYHGIICPFSLLIGWMCSPVFSVFYFFILIGWIYSRTSLVEICSLLLGVICSLHCLNPSSRWLNRFWLTDFYFIFSMYLRFHCIEGCWDRSRTFATLAFAVRRSI